MVTVTPPKCAHCQKIEKIIHGTTTQGVVFAILDVTIEGTVMLRFVDVGFDYALTSEWNLLIRHVVWMLPE